MRSQHQPTHNTPKGDPVTPLEQDCINQLLKPHQEVIQVVGLLKGDRVKFHIDHLLPSVAPYQPVTLAYRAKLSEHLAKLQHENRTEDMDPDRHSPWIANIVTTGKKDKQQIRMNINMGKANKALKRTAHHMETIQEMRHLFKGATHYSEMNLSHGFHQI